MAENGKTILLAEVDKLIEEYNGKDAYLLLSKNFGAEVEDVEVCERFAKCLYIRANCEEDLGKRSQLLADGRRFAVRGLGRQPEHFESLKFAAALTGVLAEQEEGTRKRINLGYEFKDYLDRALAIQSTDLMLLHMRGRFSYHIAGVGLLERGLAALFFRSIPTASYEDALRDFLAMEEQSEQPAVDNLLFIGKCYKQMGQNDKAVEYLSKVVTGSPADFVDAEQMEEARDLLLDIDPHFEFEDEETDESEEEVVAE